MITVEKIQKMGSGGRWDQSCSVEDTWWCSGVCMWEIAGPEKKILMQSLQNKQKPSQVKAKIESAAILYYFLPFLSLT